MKYFVIPSLIVSLLLTVYGRNEEHYNQIMIDTAFDINVVDASGNDLLDPAHENTIDQKDIEIYYEVNGELIRVNKPLLDAPKGFSIIEGEGLYPHYLLRIYGNTTDGSNQSTIYIKWRGDRQDMIACQLNREGSTTVCTKIWLNEELVWDVRDPTTWQESSGTRFFRIILN